MNRIRKRMLKMSADEIQQDLQQGGLEPSTTFNAPPGLEKHEPSVEEAQQLVGEAKEGIDNLIDAYENLFEILNNLAKNYPSLYDELKLAVRFPNENDAEDIAQMQTAFEDCADHYQDPDYLKSIIGTDKTPNGPQQ